MQSIQEIDVKNFMRIRRATLRVEGNTLVLSGENASGKSSFLTAIENLFGGKDRQPKQPVRKGATEATIVGAVTCADGRKLRATVTIKAGENARRLVVTDESGKQQGSPQELLNAFWAATSFDPGLFLASSSPDQVTMLKKIGGLDFTALDQKRKALFDERTNVNRQAATAKAALAGAQTFPDAPAEEVSVFALTDELDAAESINAAADALLRDANRAQEHAAAKKNDLSSCDESIAALEAKLAGLRADRVSIAASAAAAEVSAADAKVKADAAPRKDVAPIRQQIRDADAVNTKVRANKRRADAQAALTALEKKEGSLTTAIDGIDEEKSETLRAAKFPVDGLAFDERGATYKGLPLEQASDSERVAIGVQMAAAMNPGKTLMLIRHGNLFTDKNFHVLNDIAERLGLTCIIEVPGPKRSDTVLIFEDGIGYEPTEKLPSESPPAVDKTGELPLT